MGGSDNLCRLYGSPQVAGNDDINGIRCQPFGHLPCLFPTPLVQLTLRLALHDLAGVVHRLAMPHQQDGRLPCCVHRVSQW